VKRKEYTIHQYNSTGILCETIAVFEESTQNIELIIRQDLEAVEAIEIELEELETLIVEIKKDFNL
jgi:hypothetical protein